MTITFSSSVLLIAGLCASTDAFLQHTASTGRIHQQQAPYLHHDAKRASISVIHSSSLSNENENINDRPQISLVDDDEDEAARNSQLGPSEDERPIPTTGISVADEMDAAQRDVFVTEVVPIEGLPGVAQLVSSPVAQDAFEPVRYLVALETPTIARSSNEENTANDPTDNESQSTQSTSPSTSLLRYENTSFVMVDIPPYSPQLATRLKAFMGVNHTLTAMVVTSSDAIHADEAPGQMYSLNRRAALIRQWKEAFPETSVITYRLDTPRDCHAVVTQKLDGQGPFGWNPTTHQFDEMGRPLTVQAWDDSLGERVMKGEANPEQIEAEYVAQQSDKNNNNPQEKADDSSLYSPEAIRAREEQCPILAISTPGHSFGSVSYVFPALKVVVSGYTIPVEDNRADGGVGAGPALDVRGYITTSQAGLTRQMESARHLVETYGDRFETILPSRGDPLDLRGNEADVRQEILMGIVDQYDRIGQIYEQLGITGGASDDFNP